MRVVRALDELTTPLTGAVATLGNFDGIHLGHREIFRRVRHLAKDREGTATVITFIPHPLKVLAPERSLPLITTYAQKEELIAASGIDCLLTLPFDAAFAALSAADFVRLVLVERVGVRHLVVGYDYRFGAGREGNADSLLRAGHEHGFAVEVLPPITRGGVVYSSSEIRRRIAAGDVHQVVSLLGRHFSLSGKVVPGRQRGHGLGFPTANLATEQELLPADGVYAVKVRFGEQLLDGACNIGVNPTFANPVRSVEVFLFDFAAELYGAELRLFFIERIREERRFADTGQLSAAIAADVARCREILRYTTLLEYREVIAEEMGE